MSDFAIKIENLSKQYRLGLIGTGTLSHDLKRWWYLVRGKEDPYLRIGETNHRSEKGSSEYVWALKNIDIEVKKGEVLGIIGKNGAGKSTLLKILSKVTGPTTGKITYKGRIGSLLEVGTGFHPELTGIENIYLNGSILGMKKSEIKSKLDAIIDFSGCGRYIDTPVKRYSSGMKVRLGFAVAAFLEPEILVVDEVLAVGDAEFQQKAIGKIQEVSQGQGRTILFVSHNMKSVELLCTKSVWLKNGEIANIGSTSKIIQEYLNSELKEIYRKEYFINQSKENYVYKVEFDDQQKKSPFYRSDEEFYLNISTFTSIDDIELNISLFKDELKLISIFSSEINGNKLKKGEQITRLRIPASLLNEGVYYFKLSLFKYDVYYDLFPEKIYFKIITDHKRYQDHNKMTRSLINVNLGLS